MEDYKPPSRSKLKKCHHARDAYYSCKAGVKQDDDTACADLKKAFTTLCPASWVEHFNRQSLFEKYKKTLHSEGFKPAKE